MQCECCGTDLFDKPGDMDFATDASSEQTKAILREGPYTDLGTVGEKFGTITCVRPGFHWGDATPEEVEAIKADDLPRMRELGLARVRAGTHASFSTEEELEQCYLDMQKGTAIAKNRDDRAQQLCFLCRVRGQLCLHNVSQHPGVAHCSRPGEHNGGDPTTCDICIESRKKAAWARARGFCVDWTTSAATPSAPS